MIPVRERSFKKESCSAATDAEAVNQTVDAIQRQSRSWSRHRPIMHRAS